MPILVVHQVFEECLADTKHCSPFILPLAPQHYIKDSQGSGTKPKSGCIFRPLGDETNKFQGLVLGDIDGATLGPQGAIEGKKAGLNLLVNAADVIDLPLAGIGATKKRIAENSDQIRRLLRASLKGIQYIRENRTGTVEIIKTWFKLEPDVAAATYDLAFKAFSRDGEVNEKGICLSMDLARLSGTFDKDISPAEVGEFSLLRRARSELGW